MKKTILAATAALMMLLAISRTASAQTTCLGGIPEYAPAVVSVSLNQAARKALSDSFVAVLRLPEFAEAKALYEKNLGVPMPLELAGFAGSLEGIESAAFLDDMTKPPSVLMYFRFVDERSAAGFAEAIKSAILKVSEASKVKVAFAEKKESGFRTVYPQAAGGAAYDPFQSECPVFFSSGKIVGTYLLQKKDEENSRRYLADSLAAMKSGKGSFLSNPKLTALTKKAGGYQIVVFQDGSAFKAGALKAGVTEMADAVDCILFLATIDEAFTTVNGRLTVSLNKKADGETAYTRFFKKMISAPACGINPYSLAPKDSPALAYLNLNMDKDFRGASLVSGIGFLAQMMGISAENDVFSWLAPPLAVSIGADGRSAVACAAASDTKKAAALIDRLSSGLNKDFEITDGGSDPVRFKTFAKKDGGAFCLGTVSGAFLAAAGRTPSSGAEAFSKAAAAAADPAGSLASSEGFRAIAKYDPAAFFGFYADCGRYNDAINEIRKSAPDFSARTFPAFLGSAAVSAAVAGADISVSAVLTLRPDRIVDDLKRGVLGAGLFEKVLENIPLRK